MQANLEISINGRSKIVSQFPKKSGRMQEVEGVKFFESEKGEVVAIP